MLYVKKGSAFQPAPDAFLIECAQHLIDSAFCASAKRILTTEQVRDFLTLHIGGRDEEVFAVLLLTHDRRFIRYEGLFQGSVTTAQVEVRRVLAAVVRSRASSVIIARQSPDGRVIGAVVFSFRDRGI